MCQNSHERDRELERDINEKLRTMGKFESVRKKSCKSSLNQTGLDSILANEFVLGSI